MNILASGRALSLTTAQINHMAVGRIESFMELRDRQIAEQELGDDERGQLPDPSDMDNATYGGLPNGRV